LFIKHNMKKKKKTTPFVIDLKNENKNTRKGVIRLVIVVVALHVAYCLSPTLLQANKGSKHDLKSRKKALQWILLSLLHVGYHLPSYSSTTIVIVLSIMKKLCRMYKIIVAIMDYISCNMFLLIKFRMYV
jgi:hypothetical protein